jgi:hypothetical protein
LPEPYNGMDSTHMPLTAPAHTAWGVCSDVTVAKDRQRVLVQGHAASCAQQLLPSQTMVCHKHATKHSTNTQTTTPNNFMDNSCSRLACLHEASGSQGSPVHGCWSNLVNLVSHNPHFLSASQSSGQPVCTCKHHTTHTQPAAGGAWMWTHLLMHTCRGHKDGDMRAIQEPVATACWSVTPGAPCFQLLWEHGPTPACTPAAVVCSLTAVGGVCPASAGHVGAHNT